jgi:Flp pilus assembly protein TadD
MPAHEMWKSPSFLRPRGFMLALLAVATATVVLTALHMHSGEARVSSEPGRAPSTPGTEPDPTPSSHGDPVTFAEDVAPILFRHCSACHRPEGPGPFSVLQYEEVRPMATAIAAAVTSGRMPPWLPAPGRGEFEGDRSLTPSEVELLQVWAAQGAPEGDPDLAPEPPPVSDGWYLGQPDLVVEMPRPYTVPGRGDGVDHASHGGEREDFFRHFVLPLPFSGQRWIEAVELRISEPGVVHHAEIMVDHTPTARRLDERDPEPGYDASASAGTESMPPGFFLGWTPGLVPTREDEGMAWPLHGDTDLVLQFHLMPRTEPVQLSARVGIHFADGPPTRVPTILKLTSETIDIPAGEATYLMEDGYRLPVDVEVLGVYPHAHFLAREVRVAARLPDGRERWLLHIPEWDFNWQDAYRFREPVSLPEGSVVSALIRYDNTAANPHNPHDPPQRVTYGPRSTDEMGDVYLRLLPRNPEDLGELERDLTVKGLRDRIAGLNHRLEHDSADTGALLGLGEVYVSIQAWDRAIPYLRRLLDLVPGDHEARHMLGIALQGDGDTQGALDEFRTLAASVPDQVAPHLSLANTLVLAEREAEAEEHYRRVLELEPGHPSATGNLAVVLFATGRAAEGLELAVRGIEAYARSGDGESLVELLELTLEEARGAGATGIVEQLEELRRRLGR